MEVDFIPLGDAAERLAVPSPTLRHWTDQLEEFNVHFVKRNNRNERIYYDNDLKIFTFLRDLKQEYGRRTTTRDLALMISEMSDNFDLRTQEDAPSPKPSHKTEELLSHEDIQRLMASDRVRQFIGVIIDQKREELLEKVRETVKEEMRLGMIESQKLLELKFKEFEESQKKREDEQRKREEESQKKREDEQRKREEEYKEIKEMLNKMEIESMTLLKEQMQQRKKEYEERQQEKQQEKSKGFFGRLFGGK